MSMISENWGNLLVPGLRKVFHTRLRAREELVAYARARLAQK
jgi:hypothetical protein